MSDQPPGTRLIRWWMADDPLFPGVSYVIVYCVGVLLASASPKLAAGLAGGYLLLAAGLRWWLADAITAGVWVIDDE